MLLRNKSSRPATLVATALALDMAGSSIAKFGQAFGSRTAFIQGPDIFSMNPDGSDVRQLTYLGANNSAFFENWSPDGRQLVFAEYPNKGNPSNAQLWLMDDDGSNQHLLLSEADHGGNAPSFSPDGAWVIFSRCESSPSSNGCAIYKIQRNGSDLMAITHFSPLAGDWDPVYSPDGMTIAFTSYGREGLFSAIWLMNPDGSNIRRLTRPELSGGVPQWSPDGDRIVFRTHCCNPQNADIWVINRDGSGLHRLTGSTTSDHDIPVAYVNEAPSWSPHGHAVVFDQFPSIRGGGVMRDLKNFLIAFFALLFSVATARATFPGQNGKIVFVGNQSVSWQLYTIDPDGRDIRQITNLPATDFDLWAPAFSPDGTQIAFCYGSGNFPSLPATEIYTINADGTGLRQLTHDGSFDCWPRWSRDGSHIVFVRQFAPTNEGLVTVMRSDGSEKTTLTNGEFRFWGTFGPTYTPDGRHVVFYSSLGGFISAVWIINSNGTDPDRLTPAPLEAFPFDVSPDGRHILAIDHENTGLPTAIYVTEINGKHIQPITHLDNVHDIPGSYSPDGKKIVFYSDRLNSEFTFDLFTMNPDGSDITKIATAVGSCQDANCVDAAWGPKPSK